MRPKKILLFISIFCASLFVGGLTARLYNTKASAGFNPYTIIWKVSDYDVNGNGTFVYTELRWKNADGRWRNIKVDPDGTITESFAEPGQGVFGVGQDKLHFLSHSQTESKNVKASDYLNSPQYIRSEVVNGLETVVLKSGSDSSLSGEFYVAPALNGDVIKTVIHIGNVVRVIEPVSLTFGNPDSSVFRHDQLPVSYEKFNQIQRVDKDR